VLDRDRLDVSPARDDNSMTPRVLGCCAGRSASSIHLERVSSPKFVRALVTRPSGEMVQMIVESASIQYDSIVEFSRAASSVRSSIDAAEAVPKLGSSLGRLAAPAMRFSADASPRVSSGGIDAALDRILPEVALFAACSVRDSTLRARFLVASRSRNALPRACSAIASASCACPLSRNTRIARLVTDLYVSEKPCFMKSVGTRVVRARSIPSRTSRISLKASGVLPNFHKANALSSSMWRLRSS